jgi:hypothetical protein
LLRKSTPMHSFLVARHLLGRLRSRPPGGPARPDCTLRYRGTPHPARSLRIVRSSLKTVPRTVFAPASAGAAPHPSGLRLRAIGPGKGPLDLCFRVLWRPHSRRGDGPRVHAEIFRWKISDRPSPPSGGRVRALPAVRRGLTQPVGCTPPQPARSFRILCRAVKAVPIMPGTPREDRGTTGSRAVGGQAV